MLKSVVVALLGLAASFAHADGVDSAQDKVIRDAVRSLAPAATVDLIAKSDLPGFYEVIVGGHVVYVSADGKYLFEGEVFSVADKKSLTSRAQAGLRYASLKKLPVDKQIVFAPANPKHTITVFTDVDCPYCKQFHKQIDAFNQMGIAVHYVLFPLSIHPGADKKAVSVWCSQDRNSAYTAAMNGQDPGKKTCDNPVAETTALGLKIGINGTPTVLAADGTQVSGTAALDPARLLAELDKIDAAAAKPPVAAN